MLKKDAYKFEKPGAILLLIPFSNIKIKAYLQILKKYTYKF